MSNSDELKDMQNELQQLNRQLQLQQDQIQNLQQRISSLTGSEFISHSPSTSFPKENKSIENYIGLNVIHLVGIIVLVIGISIGVKYAIDKEFISEQVRIALAYGAGLALLFFSYKLKEKYSFFSAILFSGAMASLYFTTYAACVYYTMFSFGTAFAVMVALTIFTIYQALIYNRQEIALLGFVGAYAIPFLISKNSDRADLFFAYIALINVGVVFLSIKKEWFAVGKVAQYITWILFIGWALTFNPSVSGIGLLFMSFFFLLFLFNGAAPRIIYKKPLHISNIYDVIVNNFALFIAALFVFGGSYDYASFALITFFAFVVASLQAAVFQYLWREEKLMKMLLAYAFIAFNAFIAFQWQGIVVTLLWLLTAICIFVIGVYKKWMLLRLWAILLLGATLVKLVTFDSLSFSTVQKVISYLALGVLLLIISFFYQKFRQQLFNKE